MKRLAIEFREILKDPNYFYSCAPKPDNMFLWDFNLIGPPDTMYSGGIFTGIIRFTSEYPHKPPVVKFDNILHPNIYKTGQVCISILHEGSDAYGYEKDSERWSPSQSINSILMSILSMLSEPNFDSPANVDASTLWKNDIATYRETIYRMVAQSQ